MAKNKILLATLGTIFSGYVVAGTMGPVEAPAWRKVIGLSLGPAWTSSNESESFYTNTYDPDFTDAAFVALNNSNSLGFGELFLGMQHHAFSAISGQIGLALGGSTSARINGNVWSNGNPEFNYFSYGYKVDQLRVALKGKLFAEMNTFVDPYISGSVGVGFNRAHDYTLTPNGLAFSPYTGFSDNTTTSFTYTLGVGLQKSFREHFQVGVGYQFADLGKTQLGRMPNQNINNGLHLDHIYTHGVEFNFSYIV